MDDSRRAFSDLTLEGQIRRLRRLAHEALVAYGHDRAALRLLSSIQNTTFRVRTVSGEQFALRISHPGAGEAEVRSELLWLDALRQDTALGVPEPVWTRDGNLLAVLGGDAVGGRRPCVLFRWLDGRQVDRDALTPQRFEQVGALMAGLHTHARHWQPPADFARYRIDADIVAGFVQDVLPNVARALSETSDAATVVARTADAVVAAMRELGDDRDVFGVVHADLSPSNVLFDRRGQAQALDFDDCCWGHYLYDMGLTVRDVELERSEPALRAALLRGYRTVRPLPPEHAALLDTFVAAVNLLRMLWVLGRAEQPTHRDWAPAFVARSLDRLRSFLQCGAASRSETG